jgi:predicted MPP superfamily phosphohydrolase
MSELALTIEYLYQHHPAEAVRLTTLVAALTAFYVAAVLSLLFLCLSPRRDHPGRLARAVRFGCRALVSLSLCGLVALAYAFLIEPNWLEVRTIAVESHKLAGAERPIRVVQISDTHCENNERLEGGLPEIVAGLQPDLIVFTGDTANSLPGVAVFKHLFSRLSRIAPTLAVTGNWEAGRLRGAAPFAGTGVRELQVEAVPMRIAGKRIWVSGVPVDHQEWQRAVERIPATEFSIFLDHYSDRIYDVASRSVDLYLSGQTHGGQVAMPFYGPVVTFAQYGDRFNSGLYRVDKTLLYVNRGLGMTGGAMPRLRFLARPEIALFVLSPERSAAATDTVGGEMPGDGFAKTALATRQGSLIGQPNFMGKSHHQQ